MANVQCCFYCKPSVPVAIGYSVSEAFRTQVSSPSCFAKIQNNGSRNKPGMTAMANAQCCFYCKPSFPVAIGYSVSEASRTQVRSPLCKHQAKSDSPRRTRRATKKIKGNKKSEKRIITTIFSLVTRRTKSGVLSFSP